MNLTKQRAIQRSRFFKAAVPGSVHEFPDKKTGIPSKAEIIKRTKGGHITVKVIEGPDAGQYKVIVPSQYM